MLLSSFNIYSSERISNSIKNKAKEEKYVTTQILSCETFSAQRTTKTIHLKFFTLLL